MINFNVVDFSEFRSEEVISLFWCSVYLEETFNVKENMKFPSLIEDQFGNTPFIRSASNFVRQINSIQRHHC